MTLNVQALPLNGKPAAFSGAIGKFTLEKTVLSTQSVKLGEPVSLSFLISGEGNFPRIAAPILSDNEDWRIYPPEENFSAKDPYGYSGTKVFEYILIPMHEGKLRTPEITFNYFDPSTANYVSLTQPAYEVEVRAAAPGSTTSLPTKLGKGQSQPESSASKILPIATQPGTWLPPSLQPPFLNPYFIAGQALPLAALLLLITRRRKKIRLAEDLDYAKKQRSQKQVKNFLIKAKQAAAKRKPHAFYEAALHAIQEAAGPALKAEPHAIIFPELEDYLKSNKLSPQDIACIKNYFVASDALRFGQSALQAIDLRAELKTLERIIRLLPKTRA